jgi:hypothetical protein
MRARAIGVWLLAGVAACSFPARIGTPERVTEVPYRAVDWDPGHAVTGPVVSVLDAGDDLVVFEADRATVFVDGAVAATEKRPTGWSSGALLPAPDRSGEWMLGLDREGKMHRLRARKGFEPVSARFGLGGTRVIGAAAVGGKEAIFSVEGGFALSDGDHLRRFAEPEKIRAVAGGPFTAVVAMEDRVLVVDTRTGRSDRYELAAAAVAVDSRGRVLVETERALYTTEPPAERPEGAGPRALELVFAGRRLHGLARSGDRMYFADESNLYTLEVDGTHRASGVVVDPDARLEGSTTGDVWVLSRAGKLSRFARGSAVARPAESSAPTYARDIAPLISRDCGPCHAEGGETGIVLTAEAGLRSRRDLVRQRVLVDGDMPPKSRPLPAADKALLERWLSSGAR